MQSLICNNINTRISLSSWVVHLVFVFCRLRWLCVHSYRCTRRVRFGFDTSSFVSSIPREAEMSVSYLWSPFPLAAPCHFLAGFVCVCECTAGEGVVFVLYFLQLPCLCEWKLSRRLQDSWSQLRSSKGMTSNSSRDTNHLPGLNLVLPGVLNV